MVSRGTTEVRQLLNQLNEQNADSLEDQDLDFKEWNIKSMKDAVDLLVESAICMANGGGGTIVFGVNDKAVGREDAILGVPPEVDINRLKKLSTRQKIVLRVWNGLFSLLKRGVHIP